MSASTAYSDEDTKLKNLNTFSAILLGVFTVTAFVTNIFLLSTIASSYYLRNTVFYFHVLHIACINLAHTAVNSLLSMLYVSTGHWKLGDFACSLNAFVGELLAVETMYGVTLATLDRAIALLSIAKYDSRLTPLRTAIALAGCWLVGIIITFPVLIGSIRSDPFPARFFCSVSNNPLGYPIATLIICYIFPLFVILWSVGVVLYRMHKDRVRRRAMLPDRFGDYTDFIVDNRRVQKHMELAKYSVILFIIYYILQGPYYTFKFFSQIRNSADGQENYGANFDTPADAETAIALLYSLFLVVYPLLTFCYAKDIWKKFQDLICCRKTNVVSTTVVSSGSATGGPAVRVSRPNEEVHTANVVTIMPTSDGIHQIRPGSDEPEYADVPRRNDRNIIDNRNQPGQRTDGGTSDYDSEDSDTFEEANPDNLNKNKSSVTAQVYKNEMVDGAMRTTRLEIDSNQKNEDKLSSKDKQDVKYQSSPLATPTASQSEIRLQSSDNNKINKVNVVERAAPNHKRSKSESETNISLKDSDAKHPKRKSLDETITAAGRLPTVSRRSSVRLLNPGAVPSPVNVVRNKSSTSNHPRLPPIPPTLVPNMPDNRLSTDNFEMKPNSLDLKTAKVDGGSAENKKRKISTIRPKRKT